MLQNLATKVFGGSGVYRYGSRSETRVCEQRRVRTMRPRLPPRRQLSTSSQSRARRRPASRLHTLRPRLLPPRTLARARALARRASRVRLRALRPRQPHRRRAAQPRAVARAAPPAVRAVPGALLPRVRPERAREHARAARARLRALPARIPPASTAQRARALCPCGRRTLILVCNAPSPREKPSNKSLSPVSGSHVTHYRHCIAAVDTEHYNAHVVQQHSDLVFLCDECRDYVNRKEFFRHMALHAIDYHLSRGRGRKQKEPPGGNRQEEHKSDTIKEQQICLKTSDCIVKDNQTDPEKVPVTKTESPAKEVGSEVKSNASRECAEASNVTDENEFSDRSDSEFGFEPIPSSVFRAIEDSQDTQPTRDDATVSEPDKTNTANELPNVVTETENELKSAVTTNAAKNESKSVKKSRTCEICGKVCNAPSTYFYHMKHTHRRSRDHPCADCGKRFGTRAALTAHGSVHDARALHECSTCGKAFRTRAGLYIHEQAHSGNKPHSCATCGAGFRWRTQLSRHAARHLARRAHACGTCGRAFSVRADLLRHARTHAAAALPCPHCGLRLAQPRYLKVHIRKRHPDVADKV